MSADATATDESPLENRWVRGALAGLAAGIVTGGVLQLNDPAVLRSAIPAVYGVDGLLAGWVAHLAHGTIAGLVYATVADDENVRERAQTPDGGAALGLGYGLALWVVVAAVLVPLVLDAMGSAAAPGFPYVDLQALLAFLLLGTVIGAVYGMVAMK